MCVKQCNNEIVSHYYAVRFVNSWSFRCASASLLFTSLAAPPHSTSLRSSCRHCEPGKDCCASADGGPARPHHAFIILLCEYSILYTQSAEWWGVEPILLFPASRNRILITCTQTRVAASRSLICEMCMCVCVQIQFHRFSDVEICNHHTVCILYIVVHIRVQCKQAYLRMARQMLIILSLHRHFDAQRVCVRAVPESVRCSECVPRRGRPQHLEPSAG